MIFAVFLITMPGGFEWVLIFLAVVLLFGGKKIPDLMRNVGKGINEFKAARKNKDKYQDPTNND